jgi:hypothetical protein
VDGRHNDLIRVQQGKRVTNPSHINHRIKSAHLVEMNQIHRATVNLPFCGRHSAVNDGCFSLDRLGQPEAGYQI